jgi:hypothetical protein
MPETNTQPRFVVKWRHRRYGHMGIGDVPLTVEGWESIQRMLPKGMLADIDHWLVPVDADGRESAEGRV